VKIVKGASDPSVSGPTLAYAKGQGDASFFTEGQGPMPLPGTDPSISDEFAAVLDGNEVRILERPGFAEVDSFGAQGVDAVAVSDNWIVYRTRQDARDRLYARPLEGSGVTGEPKRIASAGSPDQVSQPGLDGNTLVYAISTRKSSRIVRSDLGSMSRDVVIRSDTQLLTSPSVRGSSLLYVRGVRGGYELKLKKVGNNDTGRTLLRRDKRLWSTALSAKRAYVTVLSGEEPRASITSVQR
jgi:hypothetical protein